MDLATDLQQLRGKIGVGGRPCSVKTYMDTLTGKDLKAFQDALEDRTITNVALFSYLKSHNILVTSSQLQTHRAKQCRCYL